MRKRASLALIQTLFTVHISPTKPTFEHIFKIE